MGNAMTASPTSPRLLRGALIGFDIFNPLAAVIYFQYTPETMTRRLEARAAGGGENSDRSEAFRLSGPPKETITLSGIEIDATDQLEQGNPLAIATGVHTTLASLEMPLYPKSIQVIKNLAEAQVGTLEIIPPEAPLTLFVWGAARVLPVRVTSFSVTEEAYDTLLNPIRAKVDLSLQVLSYMDLSPGNAGFAMFMTHQISKELMASANVVNSVMNFGSSFKLF